MKIWWLQHLFQKQLSDFALKCSGVAYLNKIHTEKEITNLYFLIGCSGNCKDGIFFVTMTIVNQVENWHLFTQNQNIKLINLPKFQVKPITLF